MEGQPFFFDNNMFDDDPLVGMDEEEVAKAEFTKDQLEIAKNKAYKDGAAAGFKESEAGLTKTTLTLLQKIERDMSVILAAEDDRNKEYEGEAVHLALYIIQKLFPLYTKEHGEEELKSAIKSALLIHNTPDKIKIELHGDILQNLKEHIKELESDLNKQIIMTANNNLKQSECQILWANGGIICNHDEIAEKTFTIMKETLAERGISVHDKKQQNNDDKPSGET